MMIVEDLVPQGRGKESWIIGKKSKICRNADSLPNKIRGKIR